MSQAHPGETGNATVAQRLADAFARHGVSVTFGQSLPSAFHLAASRIGIRQAGYRQENMGGAMADGYARISGRAGVVTAQNGPAAALLVAPLAEALKVSVPVVALVQEVDRGAVGKNAFQELDHVRMFEPVAKWIGRIDRADRLEDFVDMAFAAACSGRPGPAVLLAPPDLLAEAAGPVSPRHACLGHYPLDRTAAHPDLIRSAAELLASAQHPLVVAGGGVHLSGAVDECVALQDETHLPVATTTMGKGAVSENHPLSLGVIGYYMGRGGRTHGLRGMVERADVILFVGTRTNQNGTDSWRLFPRDARIIHIDPDPLEIGRNYEAAVRLTGDARTTLAALRHAMLALDLRHRAAARPEVERKIADAVAAWRSLVSGVSGRSGGPIRPERVMAELDRLLPDDGIAVADASYSSIWLGNYLTARRAGQRFLTPRGLAGLGWGLPLAIGAQIAAPGRRVVCVCGDGGFAHSWAELETLRRLRLPVITLVLNNGILGFQRDAEDMKYGEHTDACDLLDVDHAAIAKACGVTGIRVARGEDLPRALGTAFDCDGPVVLDIVTDPAASPPIGFFAGHVPDPF